MVMVQFDQFWTHLVAGGYRRVMGIVLRQSFFHVLPNPATQPTSSHFPTNDPSTVPTNTVELPPGGWHWVALAEMMLAHWPCASVTTDHPVHVGPLFIKILDTNIYIYI